MPGLNLHGIVGPIIAAVNPFVVATVYRSLGNAPDATGQQVPQYDTGVPIRVQVQSLTYTDVMRLDGLSIQGVRRAIYTDASIDGMIRIQQKGGDVIVFPPGVMPEGSVWNVALVLETWPSWRKIALTLQADLF